MTGASPGLKTNKSLSVCIFYVSRFQLDGPRSSWVAGWSVSSRNAISLLAKTKAQSEAAQYEVATLTARWTPNSAQKDPTNTINLEQAFGNCKNQKKKNQKIEKDLGRRKFAEEYAVGARSWFIRSAGRHLLPNYCNSQSEVAMLPHVCAWLRHTSLPVAAPQFWRHHHQRYCHKMSRRSCCFSTASVRLPWLFACLDVWLFGCVAAVAAARFVVALHLKLH